MSYFLSYCCDAVIKTPWLKHLTKESRSLQFIVRVHGAKICKKEQRRTYILIYKSEARRQTVRMSKVSWNFTPCPQRNNSSNQNIPFNPYPVGDQLFKYEELQKSLSFKLPHYTPWPAQTFSHCIFQKWI